MNVTFWRNENRADAVIKKQLLTFGLACWALAGPGVISANADYASDILAAGPIAYWPLNENAVVPPADLAKNSGSLGAAADGFYLGTASHPVPGALAGSTDSAAMFDATANTVVSVPYASGMNPSNAFTVEAWLNPNVALDPGVLTSPLSSGQFGDPRAGWLLYQSDTGWNLRFYNRNGLTTSLSITAGPAPQPGVWYHLVAVYNGTTAKIYVNGVESASGTPTGYVPGAGGKLFIGGRADSSFWWNGAADEVAIYPTALPPSTIDAHYRNGTNAAPATPYNQLVLASNPVGYYRLNEDAFAPAPAPMAANVGTYGSSYDATYNPGVNGKASGPRPPALSGFPAANTAGGFNGNSGYIGTPLSLNDLTAFSVMGWIKRGTNHSVRGGYFGQNDFLEIGDADGGTNVEVYINAYGASMRIPYPFRDDEWGHFAFVGDSTRSVIYTNGFPASTMNRAIESFGASVYLFNIGGGGIFNVTGDVFLGGIDEVAVFDKALTETELLNIYYGANISPAIVKQPTAPTRPIVVGNYVTLTVAANGTAPLQYQWRKGGTPIAGKTAPELLINGITAADGGTYDVVVSNAYGSLTSSAVTLTVAPAESVPPQALYADSSLTFTNARIFFSEPLDPVTAQNPANYQISDGTNTLPVLAAILASPAGTAGDNMVDLITASQVSGRNYTVTINGVKDQTAPGNTIAANSKIQFTAWTFAPGFLTFEHYDNLTGAADADITAALQDPRVIAGKPTTAGFITGRFDSRTIFPDDSHENFMSRITGWILPLETGDYDFFLRSDDASRLYLSSDETIPDPATATPIAIEEDCCDPFYEPGADPATTAIPVRLEAGRRYGVLVLHKEGGGGDSVQVAWRKTTDSTEATALPYLPGQFFGTYVNPNAEIVLTTQPTDQPGTLPTPVIDFVSKTFTNDNAGFTVENTDPAPPGPWEYDQANAAWSAPGGNADCGGPYNSKLTTPAYTIPVSEEVTLTFAHRYSFEPDRWDGGQVWISVNGGAFTPVAATNFTANGYPAGVIQGSGVIKDQAAFHDISPGYSAGTYITSSVILGSFQANDTIAVQFVGAWDDCSTGETPSWVIRNVSLAYGTAARASTFVAAATATRQGQPTSFTYQWQRNDGAGFTDIPNENSASLRIFPTAADFTAFFRLVVKVPGKELVSTSVKLIQGSTNPPPEISIIRSGASTTITYSGTLQSAGTIDGPFTTVDGASSPYTVPQPTANRFYRSVR
jgi:hypothetical protein